MESENQKQKNDVCMIWMQKDFITIIWQEHNKKDKNM
jgi:hypothetical protein